MKERISKLASGIVEYEKPQVILYPEVLEETVSQARTIRGEIRIESQTPLKGLIYSTDHRLDLSRSQFFGSRVVIEYQVASQYVTKDLDMEGEIHLVFNGGERSIPYHFAAEPADVAPKQEPIETLEEFAAYTKEHYEEARTLFLSAGFLNLPFMQNLSLRNLYDGLHVRGRSKNALEEFLTSSGAKEPVKLSIADKNKSYQMPEMGFEDQIKIKKNTWGYVEVHISTDADFIQLSSDSMSEEDFVEEEASFGYFVDGKKLHGGHNPGRIFFTTPYQQFTVEVSARLSTHRKEISKNQVEYQQHLVNFTKNYMEYHLGNKESRLLLNELTAEMGRLRSAFPTSDLLELLHAELFVMQDKKEQAHLLVEDVRARVQENRTEEIDTYCIYLYVKYLIEGGESQRMSLLAILEKYRDSGHDSLVLLLLQLRMDARLLEAPAGCIHRIRTLAENGCHSPYFVMIVCKLYEENPELLKKLDGFEMQMLLPGARRDIISEEMAERIAGLAVLEKNFDNRILQLLTLLYEKFPKKALLEAVCGMLIRGDLRDNRYFIWFERGVEEDLRLTKLYEYYLYSMPKDAGKKLPQSLLLYFSYNHALDYHAKELLYHYLLQNYEPDSSLYQAYKEQMESFALEQLFASRVDEFLLKLYQTVIYKEMIDAKVAKQILPCLCTCKITCALPQVTHVVIRYEELNSEEIYPITAGTALVPLYSEYIGIFFQDAAGNRYAADERPLKPLIWDPELAAECQKVMTPPLPLRTKKCRQLLKTGGLNAESAAFIEDVLEEETVHDLFRLKAIPSLLAFYDSGREVEKGGRGLLSLRPETLPQEDRVHYIELLVQYAYFEEAYALIQKFGYEKMKISRLFQLCSHMILQRVYMQEDFLLQLSYYVFVEEKFDNIILEYLCRYFNGSSEEMYQVFATAVRSHVETCDLEERLLAQLMYVDDTEHMDEVFRAYVNRKTVDPMILNAYLALKCYSYFLGELPMDPEVFAYIEDGAMNQPLRYCSLITMLAITRFYSENAELSEKQKEYAGILLDALLEKGMLFKYFQPLAQKAGLYYDFCDKTLIEYHGKKTDRLRLAVRLVPGQRDFALSDFPQRYEGIFVKEFSVFADEKLEYRIYEQSGDIPDLLEEGTLTQYVSGKQLYGRFSCLNQLIDADNELTQDAKLEQMEAYGMKDALVEKLFQPL